MKEWLTVAEAGLLVGKDKRQVYRWIEAGRLGPSGTRENESGVLEVRLSKLREAEVDVRRGRPRGTASRNGRRSS